MTDLQTETILGGRDPDLVHAEIALQRAALRAREKARQTGTRVAYYEDGVIKVDSPRQGS